MKTEQCLSDAMRNLPDGVMLTFTLNPAHSHVDGWAELHGPSGEQVQFALEVKRIHRLETLAHVHQRRQYAAGTTPWLLVCNRLTPALAAYCAENGINFIDSAGNMRIQVPGMYIVVEGKQENKPIAAGGRFPAGVMKLLFVLLSSADALNLPYRRLAELSGISLGMVSKAFGYLEQAHYCRNTQRGRRLMRTDELYALWINDYPGALKVKLDQLSLEAPTAWETLAPVTDEYLGGELAAAVLSDGYLIPASGIIYTPHSLLERRKALALKPVQAGPLQLITRFWGTFTLNTQAQAMLCLADLLGSGDDRNREAARIINDKHLHINESALFGD